MSNKLVAYFSASGVTERAAKALAAAIGADLHEIRPEVPYTPADLNWNDKKSRSTAEMNDPASRPAIANAVERMTDYDTLFVGFPIWWYTAPAIIKTFMETYDLSGKRIALFATSGSSGMGDTAGNLAPCCSGAVIVGGKMLNGRLDAAELKAWADSL